MLDEVLFVLDIRRLEQMLRDRRSIAVGLAEAEHDVGVDVGLLPLHRYGSGIDRLDGVDGAESDVTEHRQLRIAPRLSREDKVLGGEGLAILPEGAVPDTPGGLHAAVREHAPESILDARHRLRQPWLQVSIEVLDGQARVDEPLEIVDAGDVGTRIELLVDGVRVAPDGGGEALWPALARLLAG